MESRLDKMLEWSRNRKSFTHLEVADLFDIESNHAAVLYVKWMQAKHLVRISKGKRGPHSHTPAVYRNSMVKASHQLLSPRGFLKQLKDHSSNLRLSNDEFRAWIQTTLPRIRC